MNEQTSSAFRDALLNKLGASGVFVVLLSELYVTASKALEAADNNPKKALPRFHYDVSEWCLSFLQSVAADKLPDIEPRASAPAKIGTTDRQKMGAKSEGSAAMHVVAIADNYEASPLTRNIMKAREKIAKEKELAMSNWKKSVFSRYIDDKPMFEMLTCDVLPKQAISKAKVISGVKTIEGAAKDVEKGIDDFWLTKELEEPCQDYFDLKVPLPSCVEDREVAEMQTAARCKADEFQQRISRAASYAKTIVGSGNEKTVR